MVAAQNSRDSLLMEQSKQKAANIYKNTLNENELIYSGNEYVEFISMDLANQIVKGNPYFITDSLMEGTVSYSGIQYMLPFKFHLINQKLIIIHPKTNSPIELQNENIDHFEIGGHVFHKIPKALHVLIPTKQIYAEQIHKSHFELWVLHEKLLKATKKAEDQTATYVSYQQFVLQKNGVWSKLKSEKDLINFCQDNKHQIEEYIRSQNINFDKNFESAVLMVLKYYDSIAD
jgi:hypothetical protein